METPVLGFHLGGEFTGSWTTGNLLSLMTMNDSEANDAKPMTCEAQNDARSANDSKANDV
jgi:hypothetical protein